MDVSYLLLTEGSLPPDLERMPTRIMLVADEPVSAEWRDGVAQWMLTIGCLYFVAWGVECEIWHDAVDFANLEAFDYEEIPDDRFVMTTWHDQEPLAEALWFAQACAEHPAVALTRTVIVHIGKIDKRGELLDAFARAGETE